MSKEFVMLKLGTHRCPMCTGDAACRVDTVPVLSLFGDIDEDGCTEWGGTTEVLWDAQRARTDKEGHVQVRCASGHLWYSSLELNYTPPSEPAPPPSPKSPMEVLRVLVDRYVANRTHGPGHAFVRHNAPAGIPEWWQDAMDLVEDAEEAEEAEKAKRVNS